MSTATVVAVGTKSRRSSILLASVSVIYKFTPVAFPPGRLRLATRLNFTGFLPTINTIGIVEVAAFAASAGGSPPTVTITPTWRRTRSVARSGGCAPAASGQAAAAPPSSVMNSRRLTSSMGSPSGTLKKLSVPAYRTLSLPRKHRQVLGAGHWFSIDFGRRRPACVNSDRERAVAVSAVGRSLSSKSTLRDKLNLNGQGRSSISNGVFDARHDADHRSRLCPVRPGKCAPGGPNQPSTAERAVHRPAIPGSRPP